MSDVELLILDPHSAIPPYEQVASQIRAHIIAGRLAPGDELPSVRQLARDLRVAPNTIVRAYDELRRGGWTRAESRRGVRVSESAPGAQAAGAPSGLRGAIADVLLLAARMGWSASEVRAEIERQLRLVDPLDRAHSQTDC